MDNQDVGKAMRLTYDFVGEKIRLHSTRLLTRKRVPQGELNPQKKLSGKGTGCWIELRNADGIVLYRKKCSAFIPRQVEVRTGNAKQPFKRLQGKFERGNFSFLVPLIEGSRFLALVERLRDDRGETKVIDREVTDLEKIKINDGGRGEAQ